MMTNSILGVVIAEGKNQALVGAIPFCGKYSGPRFEDKFRSANQMDRISIAGGCKMADSQFVNKKIEEIRCTYNTYTYTRKSASSDCLCFCQMSGIERRHWYLHTYNELFPYLLPFSRYLP